MKKRNTEKLKQKIKIKPVKGVPTFKYTKRVMTNEITRAVKKLVRVIAKREQYFRGARRCKIVNIRIELERSYGTKKKPKRDRATIITNDIRVEEAIWWKAKLNPKSPKKIEGMIL
jgi:hypothetical protein